MTITTLAMVGLAFSLDLLIGEPPNALHPVAWFGRLVDALDREWSPSERIQRRFGLAIALGAPLVPAAVAGGAVTLANAISPLAGAVLAGVVLFLTISLRSLLELTETVVEASERDLNEAREAVRGLVGRETATLSAAELRSAAVESAAENLADGLVATLLPFALLAPLSVPAAVAVAAWVKGVNTLDSMLGYPDRPLGTASARLDDLVMWLPARITALAIAVAAGEPTALWRARRWARDPPSPNSGWPMATLACALSVRLVKPGAYELNSGADLPDAEDGDRAVTLIGLASAVAVLVAALLATATGTLATPPEPSPVATASVALGLEAVGAFALPSAAIGVLERSMTTEPRARRQEVMP